MTIRYTLRFKTNLRTFSKEIRNKFYKQTNYLILDFRHPSLHAKKYEEKHNIWQARVDKNIRFYFLIDKDIYVLLDIKRHPK